MGMHVHTFYRSKLTIGKNSPELLLGAGIVGFVSTVVLACKATLEVSAVREHAEETIKDLTFFRDTNSEKYLEENYKKHVAKVRIEAGVDITRLYAPAVIVGTISIAALMGSHHVLSQRNVALLGAYKLVDEAFKKYRKRVIETAGDEADNYFRYGGEEKKFEIVKEKKSKKSKENETPPSMVVGEESMYAKFFDESSPQFKKNSTLNLFFLKAQQQYANDLLHSRGHVFLNEVYDSLGIPRTKAGAMVGWVDDDEIGDGFIDFNIHNPINEHNRDFVNGYESAVLLDFNVNGVIYDLI